MVAIIALGQTFVIVSGGIDLSVGSVLGLAGIVFGWASVVANLPLWRRWRSGSEQERWPGSRTGC